MLMKSREGKQGITKKKLRIESHQRGQWFQLAPTEAKKWLQIRQKKNQSMQLDRLLKGIENTTVKESISRR